MDPQERRLVCILARVALAFVFIYHGIIPKLIYQHADELTILHQAGVAVESAPTLLRWIGLAEVLFGLAFLAFPRARWPFLVTIVFAIGTTIGVAMQFPQFLIAAFSPITLNGQMIALA